MAYKYQQIADILRQQIHDGTYPPRTMLPTEFVLCEQYNVSRQTIRKALTSLVEDHLIERQQGSGSRVCEPPTLTTVSPSRPLTIAIVATYISDYIFPSILREAETVFSDSNCSTLIFATKNQVGTERKILQNLLALPNLDGLLIEGTKTTLPNPNIDLYRKLRDRGIPFVFIHGSYRELPDAYYVVDDNYGGGYQLVDYLYKKGHRKIAGIFKSDDIQGAKRYAGFSEALRDHNLPIDDSSLFWYSTENLDMLIQESALLPDLLRAISSCTAVVCYNDQIASFLVKTLLRQGISIPQDIAVVSFDNSHYSESSSCRITSLSHGDQNVGGLAAKILLKICRGENCESIVVPWELVEKESS